MILLLNMGTFPYFPIPRFQEGLLYLPKIGGKARTASGQQFPPYANQLSALRSGYQTATFRFFLKKKRTYLKIQANSEYKMFIYLIFPSHTHWYIYIYMYTLNIFIYIYTFIVYKSVIRHQPWRCTGHLGLVTRGCWSSWSRWSWAKHGDPPVWPKNDKEGVDLRETMGFTMVFTIKTMVFTIKSRVFRLKFSHHPILWRSKEDGKEDMMMDDEWWWKMMKALKEAMSLRTMTKSWSSPWRIKCKFSRRIKKLCAPVQTRSIQFKTRHQTAPTPRQEVPAHVHSWIGRLTDSSKQQEVVWKLANSKQAEHTEGFTQSRFCTEQLLQTNVFPHRSFCTEKLLHRSL